MDREPGQHGDSDAGEQVPPVAPGPPPAWAVERSDPAHGQTDGASASISTSGSPGTQTSPAGGSPTTEAVECRVFGEAVAAACAQQAAVIDAAVDLLLEVRDRVLERKRLTGVELGKTQARTVLADIKRCAVTEVRVKAGYGRAEARTLVAIALAPERLRAVLTGTMRRGEASWALVRYFWESSGALDDDQRYLVASSLFGTDPGLAVEERLDPDGTLLLGVAWSHEEFTAACDREVTGAEGVDVVAERERRRRAYAKRAATVRFNDDGTATLSVRGPAATVAAVAQRIDRGGRNAGALGDERTLANLRCDLSLALLLYGTVAIASSGADGASEATLGTDHEAACARRETQDAGHEGGEGGADSAHPVDGDDCHCDDVGLFDEIIAPEEMDRLVRVVNALPPVELQVIVPLDTLTATAGRCAECGGPVAGAAPSGPDLRAPGPPGEGSQENSACDPSDRELGAGARPLGHQDDDEDVPEWMRILADLLPAVPGRGLVGEVLGPTPFFLTPGHARELALTPGTTLHRLGTDPVDGRCIERTRNGYRPDAEMRRQIRAADVYSRGPGSRVHPGACELDHVRPWGWAGGPTGETNLATLELPAHKSKTLGYLDLTINYRRDLTFTTLLGQVARTRVHDYRQYLHVRAQDVSSRRDLANRAVYAAYATRPGQAEPPTGLRRPGDLDESWILVTHTVSGRRRRGPAPGTPTAEEVLGIPSEKAQDDDRAA